MTRRAQRATVGRTAAILLAAGLVAGACTSDDDGTAGTSPTASSTTSPTSVLVDTPSGTAAGSVSSAGSRLGIRLSDGAPSQATPAPVVEGTPLTPEEVAAVLDRLPPWQTPDDGDRSEVQLPEQTLPPPLPNETIEALFPPPTAAVPPAEPTDAPLRVLRFQPEGDVELAPFLSVTFDQPMVPVATLDQLDASEVPVQMTPEVEGRWRWIGTRTLRFEVTPGDTDRLPQATEYRVEVPAGTTSATGSTLEETVAWEFSTPAPVVETFLPQSDSLPLEPTFFLAFDQLVDPEDVLATISLDADGERSLRLATDDEIAEDPEVAAAAAEALPGRWLAFRPTEPLPVDTPVVVEVGSGTPSAEGPRTTDEPERFRMRTFPPLRVIDEYCGGDGTCEPLMSWTIELSNPVDADTVTTDRIGIDPVLPGARVDVVGSSIVVTGASSGRTTYTVTLDGSIADVFGQTLGDDPQVEFEIGPARPSILGLDRQFVTLDPGAERRGVSVSTINHDRLHVQAWDVGPGDYDEYARYLEERWSDVSPPVPDWPVLLDTKLEVDGDDDTLVETFVDLDEQLSESGGFLVVQVEPDPPIAPDSDEYWMNEPRLAWVQSTQLGLDAIVSARELLVWTTDLTTGTPVAGVEVELLGRGDRVVTDADGLARVDLSDGAVEGLVGRVDDDVSMLPSSWYEGWAAHRTDGGTRWYVFDDRGVYRPGETVQMTGWVRRFDPDDRELALAGSDASVPWVAYDPQGNTIAEGTSELNGLGGFEIGFDLPEGANLGPAWVELRLDGEPGAEPDGTGHEFQIQEFRTPQFEVEARHESPGPYLAGQPTVVAVDARYFAGGPLPGADVTWTVSGRTTNYTPPNRDDFVFGVWQPWWIESGDAVAADLAEVAIDCIDCPPGLGEESFEQFEGRTDADGTHYLQIELEGPEIDLPANVTAEAAVFDLDRQAWASRTDVLVHPAELYVGLRSEDTFVEAGTPLDIEAIVTDIDGAAVAGREIAMEAGRVEWSIGDEPAEELLDVQSCTVTSGSEPVRCSFDPEVGGTYRVTARVVDDAGRTNRTQFDRWVSGGDVAPSRSIEQQKVTIVPDAEEYAPGDTAELLVQAPFAPATGLLTVAGGSIDSATTFDAPDGSAVLQVPVTDDDVPNLTVQVDMNGAAPRTDDAGDPLPDAPPRPAYATGTLQLSVPPSTRTLDVVATPVVDAVEPGDDTSVVVEVRDPSGAAVSGADVAVVVVDEAVLSVTGYELDDPLDAFYQPLAAELYGEYVRSSILLNRPDLVGAGADGAEPRATSLDAASEGEILADTMEAAEEATDESAAGAAAPTIDLRSDFRAVAAFAPHVSTGSDGTVVVDVPLPDNVTRYRVMAVAVDGPEHFGSGESTITARLPLTVRPSAPRFANFGDSFELPVLVQNQTTVPLQVDVAIETSNLQIVDGAGRRVTVPANDRVEVRFPVASDDAGTARARIAGASAELADAAEIELPVYTPATAEAFATYGVLDAGAVAQPVTPPEGVLAQFGGLEIGTSSTALQALTDAVLYMSDYRFVGADALATRIISIATLRDVLDAFDAEGLPSDEEIESTMRDDIDALVGLQNEDGGFPTFRRGERSEPFVSIAATQALVAADDAGYAVPDDSIDRALGFLRGIESHLPADLDQAVVDSLLAYALNVRDRAGDRDAASAGALYDRAGDELGVDALAWLWPVLDDAAATAEIERRLENAAVETPGAATFTVDYGEDAYVLAYSDERTDAIVLESLISQQPDSDLIPKVVEGLLGNQVRGRWSNAYENSFVLLAMRDYFDTFEDVEPDFVARAWLGDTYVAEHEFRGRTTADALTVVPMESLLEPSGEQDLVVATDGAGRLYYRLGMRYAPADLELAPRDEGFVVDRVYEPVDDPGDVVLGDDGVWRVRAGATVRVRVTMVADARRTNLVLLDPLPAGFEALNRALDVTLTPPPDDLDDDSLESTWCWCWRWYEHENLRDDRAEAYASILGAGTYEYVYEARATTPGSFVVPPARAEELYAPEVFGRSASASVVVE